MLFIQGDQKVSVHLMIVIIRCTETFWSPCTMYIRAIIILHVTWSHITGTFIKSLYINQANQR